MKGIDEERNKDRKQVQKREIYGGEEGESKEERAGGKKTVIEKGTRVRLQ